MARVSIPTVGDVEFPDSMTPDDVQKHAGRMHKLADISRRTGAVDVTRSLPFAQKMFATGKANPAVSHFVGQAAKDPDGRFRADFASARHALQSVKASDGKDPNQSEFKKYLADDLKEATARAGTRADWLGVDREQPGRRIGPAATPASQQSVMDLIRQRAAERTQ